MAYVQAQNASNANASALTTPGMNTTVNNFAVAIVSTDDGPKTVTSFVDSLGNSWTPLTGNPQSPNGQFNIYVFTCVLFNAGLGHTFTANFSGSAPCALVVAEFSGRATSATVIFQSAKTDGSSSNAHSSNATGTLSQAGCDVVCCSGDNAFTQASSSEVYVATSAGWAPIPTLAQVNTGATTATAFIMYSENVGTSSQQATWTNSSSNLISASFIIALAPVKIISVGGLSGHIRPIGRGPHRGPNPRTFRPQRGSQALRSILLQLFSSPGVPLANTVVQFTTALSDTSPFIDTVTLTTDATGTVFLGALNAPGNTPLEIRATVLADLTRSCIFQNVTLL